MQFQSKNIKLKSNWFDENGVVYKIGYDAFLLYLILYKFQLKSDILFVTSIDQLKKQLGVSFSLEDTRSLMKLLIKHKVVKTSITRWDQYNNTGFLLVTALDLPQLERKYSEEHKKVIDHRVTDDDYYVSINLELVQEYLDRKFKGKEIMFYCLATKYSNSTEGKFFMAVDKIAKWMSLGTDTVIKMIRELNREYLLSSYYRNHKQRGEDGIKLEHYVLKNINDWDSFKKMHSDNIEKNIKQWDKKNEPKKKLRAKIKAKAVDAEVIKEDVEDTTTVDNIKTASEPKVIGNIKSFGQPRPVSTTYSFDDFDFDDEPVFDHDLENSLPF